MIVFAADQAVAMLPIWAIYTVSFGTLLAVFIGAVLVHWVARKGAVEAREDREQQEVLLFLRWAAEKALSDELPNARVGIAAVDCMVETSCNGLSYSFRQVKHELALALAERHPTVEWPVSQLHREHLGLGERPRSTKIQPSPVTRPRRLRHIRYYKKHGGSRRG